MMSSSAEERRGKLDGGEEEEWFLFMLCGKRVKSEHCGFTFIFAGVEGITSFWWNWGVGFALGSVDREVALVPLVMAWGSQRVRGKVEEWECERVEGEIKY